VRGNQECVYRSTSVSDGLDRYQRHSGICNIDRDPLLRRGHRRRFDHPTGFPFIEIFYQAAGSTAGATAMTAIVMSMMISATLAVLAASSRMRWAFARDNGLPFSQYLMRVETKTRLPLYAITTSIAITMLLGLINIGSSAAFNAVASLVVAGYLGSYILPIGLLLHNRIRNPSSIQYGPWSLGRYGVVTNIFSLIWIVIVMVFSFFPAAIPITLTTMNWSCLIWGGTQILGLAYYFLFQRGRYNGPIVETTVIEQLHGV
jgi:choline transport protein